MSYELDSFHPELQFYSILAMACGRHKLEGFLPFADFVLDDGIIGSSGNEDYSVPNLCPVS